MSETMVADGKNLRSRTDAMEEIMAKKLDIETEINMTPMIDVVFQLIIFFMLVTEMSQADLEMLELPEASQAREDEPKSGRIVVNITKEGDIRIHGRNHTEAQLRNYLEREADKERSSDGYCSRELLIRADKDAEFKYVQHVMQECVSRRVKVWRLLVAAKETSGGFD
jgi:biopolymer transport protein ExbD